MPTTTGGRSSAAPPPDVFDGVAPHHVSQGQVSAGIEATSVPPPLEED